MKKFIFSKFAGLEVYSRQLYKQMNFFTGFLKQHFNPLPPPPPPPHTHTHTRWLNVLTQAPLPLNFELKLGAVLAQNYFVIFWRLICLQIKMCNTLVFFSYVITQNSKTRWTYMHIYSTSAQSLLILLCQSVKLSGKKFETYW